MEVGLPVLPVEELVELMRAVRLTALARGVLVFAEEGVVLDVLEDDVVLLVAPAVRVVPATTALLAVTPVPVDGDDVRLGLMPLPYWQRTLLVVLMTCSTSPAFTFRTAG